MAPATMPNVDRPRPFTHEDQIEHLRKFWFRAVGEQLPDNADIRPEGTTVALHYTRNGEAHKLVYQRQGNGRIAWFEDDSDTPIAMPPGARALPFMRSLIGLDG